jgi:hypothetical protein
MLILIALLACEQPEPVDTAPPPEGAPGSVLLAPNFDQDGDGFSVPQGDCDDRDPERYPGRTEDCNGIDDNCNEQTDEGFDDTDNDGVADCIDVEECDGQDNDGDGLIDEGSADTDGDGTPD